MDVTGDGGMADRDGNGGSGSTGSGGTGGGGAVGGGAAHGAGGAGGGDNRLALGGFLRARRARVSPEHVGLVGGRRRRVRGLRREELAQLAGISVDYYVRLEQGRATQPSPEVLDALARALGLDAAEHRHLATLAAARHSAAPRARVSPQLQRLLDSLDGFPTFVTDHRLDVVAWNAPGAELIGGVAAPERRDRNNARFLFLDPASRDVHPDWADRAAEAVGQLRVASGRYPDDTELAALITELSALSTDFRKIWDSGEITMCAAGRKRLRHPVAGLLELNFEVLYVPGAPGEQGLVVHVFSAEADSPEAAALALLGSPLERPRS
ncbi:helix-turn-helix domain-containing protein [Streptomyces sp. NPDC050504]|uniref:helix-turn-helix domain-containing protein n=1 Tax=Streptomyces sp. NPDC050504 TaxID=3365618 RepID=UPI0037A9CDD1